MDTLKIKRKGMSGTFDKFMEWRSNTTLFLGKPSSGMKTAFKVEGKPMIFLHNPKCAGTSVGKYLGVKRRSHTYASKRLSLKWWLSTYSIVIVREPTERFFSSYYDQMKGDHETFLIRKYGRKVLNISPIEYLGILKENPKLCGPQTLWTDYPSSVKPRADLVVKFEDLAQLPSLLDALGVKGLPNKLPIKNVGAKRSQVSAIDHAKILNLQQKDYENLLERIQIYYADDYREFGYPQN